MICKPNARGFATDKRLISMGKSIRGDTRIIPLWNSSIKSGTAAGSTCTLQKDLL